MPTVGDQTTREWSYNITDYALGGVAYQSDNWIEPKPDGKTIFLEQSIFLNRYDETLFEDMPSDWQEVYLDSQVIDHIRLPLFNSDTTALVGVIQGFDNGAYSIIGDEVDIYADGVLE